ncbi:MAG: hypothetical protein ACTHMC_12220 [Pseudobacter sp.]|uniref:hypothetical protein n=1 Tax=Pseudobacter sp. TaxID=2045420 RepID=UPI003F7F96E7
MKKQSFFLPALLLAGLTIISLHSSAQDSTMRRNNRTQSQPHQAQQYEYRDIRTGQNINLRYDRQKKMTYNSATGEPVNMYINHTTGDTVFGRGQYILNSYMTRDNSGVWGVDTTRIRVSDNGLFIIDGNRKLKTEKSYSDYMKSQGSQRRNNRDSL